MRTLLVVIEPPSFYFSTCVTQTRKPVRIQAFVAQWTVEALYIGILYWLARLDEFQSHAAFFAPGRQCPPAKLRPVVEDNGFRQSSLAGDPIQHSSHSQPAQRRVDLDCRTLPRAIVHDGQHPNHLPATHAIAHEIHRPAFVRLAGRGLNYRATPSGSAAVAESSSPSLPPDTAGIRACDWPASPPAPASPSAGDSRTACAGRPVLSAVLARPCLAPPCALDSDASIVPIPAACRRAARSSGTRLPHSSRLPEVPQALPVF
jgi:hypothetical protein